MALIVSQEEFNDVWQDWESLLRVCKNQRIFQTPSWHYLWWKEMGNGAQLHLTCFREDGNLIAIAPLMSVNTSLSFLGDTDLWDYHDFVIAPGKEAPVFASLFEVINDQQWSDFTLTSVPEDSSCLDYLPQLSKQNGYMFEKIPEDVAPGAILPATWDEYLSSLSKKDRHELRRKLRRLESESNFRWYAIETADGLDESLGDFFSLMRQSRQDKAEFLTPEREMFFRQAFGEMAELDFLRLFFMEIDGERVASAVCFDYGSTRFLYNSGYNPAYSQLSVGLLLNALCVRQSIDAGIRYFDFLRGDEPYKYDLGAKDLNLYRIVIRR